MSHLPLLVQQGIIQSLQDIFGDVSFKSFSPISGGCINHGGRIKTSSGDFFVKWNDAKKFPGMFEAEATGLRLLRTPQAIDIPEVISFGKSENFQFIVLEYKESRPRKASYWNELGQQLASLHKNSNELFGLDHNNYMGSLRQSNVLNMSWTNFFITQRLQPQLEMAVQSSSADGTLVKKFNRLYERLPSLLVEEKPSLLHGDLWNGNLLVNEHGAPCLIDPAVYFGNREIDLAMTQLFGGFTHEFYKSYEEAFPLQPGYQERMEIYNLYPLLVHVNLFGGSYLHQVNSILNTYV